jgi:hypothetical protein
MLRAFSLFRKWRAHACSTKLKSGEFLISSEKKGPTPRQMKTLIARERKTEL